MRIPSVRTQSPADLDAPALSFMERLEAHFYSTPVGAGARKAQSDLPAPLAKKFAEFKKLDAARGFPFSPAGTLHRVFGKDVFVLSRGFEKGSEHHAYDAAGKELKSWFEFTPVGHGCVL